MKGAAGTMAARLARRLVAARLSTLWPTLLTILLLAAAAQASAAGNPPRRLFVSGSAGGVVELRLPADWTMTGRSTPVALVFKRPGGADNLRLTAFPVPRERLPLMTDDKLQEILRTSGAPLLASSVETSLELQPLAMPAGKAYYFSLTDKKLAGKPGKVGEFPYLHSGVLRIGAWVGFFTVFSNEKNGAFAREALAAMASLHWVDAAVQERAVAKGLGAMHLPSPPPAGLQVKDQAMCVSPQALVLFGKFNETYATLLGTRTVKTSFEAYDAGAGDAGSVLYMEFDAPVKPEMRAFIAGLLWNEEFPTRMHPEEFFAAGKHLVIWCTRTDSAIKRASQARLEALLFPGK